MNRTTVVTGLGFVEAPRWHDGRLWFSDIAAGSVHAVALGGAIEHICDVHRPSGLGWLPDGSLLVISMRDRQVLRLDEGRRRGAITADGSTLVVAKTRVHRVTAFTIGTSGRLAEQRTVGALPSGSWADGLCLDAENAAWVADPKGMRCFRMAADGSITATIDTSPLQAIACVLGGADRRTLFVTLGRIRPWPQMAADRQARIDAITVDVAGAGWP